MKGNDYIVYGGTIDSDSAEAAPHEAIAVITAEGVTDTTPSEDIRQGVVATTESQTAQGVAESSKSDGRVAVHSSDTIHVVDTAPQGPLRTYPKTLLSYIGDPLGHVLNTALKPVGHFIRQVGDPAGQALLDVQAQAKEECGYEEKDPRYKGPGGELTGKSEPTGRNPLGLSEK